jgi:FixJ family two-component response regulator
MITPINISIFCLDDDADTLDDIKRGFDNAGIANYALFNNRASFLASFHECVHVAVIDHYLGAGDEIGYDVMETIFKKNAEYGSPIKCKMIIISGQDDPRMIAKYLNNGAFRYLPKYDPGFDELLIQYVKTAIREVKDFLEPYNRLVTVRDTVRDTIKNYG